MVSEIVTWFIEFSVHTALLFLLLWIMILLQKLDYNFPGLLGAAVLGGGLDMIPHFGHMLAVPALYFCIWKITRASLFPDAAFTVVVAYALMFAVNVLVFTALIGDLRPSSAMAHERDDLATNSAWAETNQPPPASTPQTDAKKAAEASAKKLTIQGVTRNGEKSSVTIKSGDKTYFVYLNQTGLVRTGDTLLQVRFTGMDDKFVTLEIGGEPVKLPLP